MREMESFVHGHCEVTYSPESSMRTVIKVLWLSIVTLGVFVSLAAQQTSPLRLIQTIPIPKVAGRIDHFDVDVEGYRLFMSALGNDTLEVFDLRANKLIRTLGGLHEPQGITFVPQSNRIIVCNSSDGTCHVFDSRTFSTLKVVRFSSDADDTRYDARSRQVIVGYGDERDAGLGILDASTGNLIGTIKLPAHPESFQLEQSGSRIFVNIPEAGEVIDVVNLTDRKVIATWALGGAGANFPMALDEKNHRLFVACRRPAEMLALNTDSGKVMAHVPCAGDADDLWYDAARKRIYVSGGQGIISVIEQENADRYRGMAEIRAAPGARTSQFVPQLNHLYLAVPRHGNQPAELRVYQVEP